MTSRPSNIIILCVTKRVMTCQEVHHPISVETPLISNTLIKIFINNLNWISHLSSLQGLDLSGIDIHKETDWLPSMTLVPSLSKLFLESCQLQNIYPSLQYANFTSLNVLDLYDNDFMSQLPDWIFNLSSDISSIVLASNNIHGQLPEKAFDALSTWNCLKIVWMGPFRLDRPA